MHYDRLDLCNFKKYTQLKQQDCAFKSDYKPKKQLRLGLGIKYIEISSCSSCAYLIRTAIGRLKIVAHEQEVR